MAYLTITRLFICSPIRTVAGIIGESESYDLKWTFLGGNIRPYSSYIKLLVCSNVERSTSTPAELYIRCIFSGKTVWFSYILFNLISFTSALTFLTSSKSSLVFNRCSESCSLFRGLRAKYDWTLYGRSGYDSRADIGIDCWRVLRAII